MKKISYIKLFVIAAAMGCVYTGCTDELSNVNGLNGTNEVSSNDSRTQLVEKELSEILADSLPTLLTDDEKATVQKLILQGELCGADILFINTQLPELVELDMKGVTFKILGTDSDYYSLNSYGNYDNKIEDVNAIGDEMFRSHKKLQKIVLPDGVTAVLDYAFEGCTSLTEVEFPQGLKIIDQYAFKNCSKLENISFTPNIREIGWWSFENTGLRSVLIPRNIQFIRNGAFNHNDSLESVIIDNYKVVMGLNVFGYCNKLKKVSLPDEMKSIPDEMFYGCTSLDTIALPSKLETIGSGAFYSTNLKNVVIPEGVVNVNDDAFLSCANLKDVVFMSNETNIGVRVFQSCSSLENINLPDMEKIPNYTFYGCHNLKTITIPETVRALGERAFSDTDLSEFVIGPNITTLGTHCLSHTELKTITVPETVTSVGDDIFYGCMELSSIYWHSDCKIRYSGYLEPNCFIFLSSKNGSTVSWDRNWKNVVIDGVAKEVFCNNSNSNRFFNCPEDIQVETIKFTKNFSSWTNLGETYGWHTISLPFKPTKIVTEDGRILAPFGSSMETEDTKPFWLRTASEEGFVDVNDIEAYTPYIICMPNNSQIYESEYNISGEVTFIGENITLKATPDTLTAVNGPDYKFWPAMKLIEAQENVYGTGGNNVFVSNREIRPMEAYIIMNDTLSTGTENIEVTRAAKASRGAMVYKKRPGVPHISDIK